MSENTVITTQGGSVNPFARPQIADHVNAGTVEIEASRAIAEAQGKLVIAKRFPRDEARAYAKIIDSCRRRGLAEEATYAFPRGGKKVSGPSIRLAEELARTWGNIDYGIRELSRKDGVSEMEAYAWDLETNTSSSQKFTVRHIRDRSDQNGGSVVLTDERDIYELTANQGARRLRARILAILPPDIVEAALVECKNTLAGKTDVPIADRVRRMVRSYEKYGVTAVMIEARLGHSLDVTLPEELADLHEIYNSIKGGVSKPSEWFGGAKPEPQSAANILEGAAPAQAAPAPAPARKVAKPKPEPAPAPAPTPEQAPPPTQPTQEVSDEHPDEADIF